MACSQIELELKCLTIITKDLYIYRKGEVEELGRFFQAQILQTDKLHDDPLWMMNVGSLSISTVDVNVCNLIWGQLLNGRLQNQG